MDKQIRQKKFSFVSILAFISQTDNLDSATNQLSSILATTQSNLDRLNDTQIKSTQEVPVKVKFIAVFTEVVLQATLNHLYRYKLT